MKALQRIFRLLTCFPVVLSLLLLLLLPERIPAHYNLYGEVDRWGSRLEEMCIRDRNSSYSLHLPTTPVC